MSGLFVSNEIEPAIARCSPGELIVQAVVREAIARGFKTFDLGVGEAAYKCKSCEAEEPLFDSAFGVTLLGHVAASTFLAARRLKRRITRSPRLFALLRRLRGATRSPRSLAAPLYAACSAAAASSLFSPITTSASDASASRASTSAASNRADGATIANTATPSRAARAAGERQS